jgi:tetratricopeptide (TPR) repeat protein
MAGSEGSLEREPAIAVVRRLVLERRTGRLVLRDGDREEVLFFVSGELYLAPTHSLALALSSGEKDSDETTAEARSPQAIWFTQAVAALREWARGEYAFDDNPAGISTDLVGPLSAYGILMADAVYERDEFQLLRRLGGETARYVASISVRSPTPAAVGLDPGEAFLLSRMERPVSVRELLQQADASRLEALRRLCRLLAVELILDEKDVPRGLQGALLDEALLSKFSKRIADSLSREPLSMSPEDQRKKIADLLGRLGTITFYELLGVGLGATSEEIHAAYSDLARLVHPLNAERLGLRGKEGGMQLVFEKATEAYLTLSDRDRSREYLVEVGSPGAGMASASSGQDRQEEIAETVERNYRMAKAMVQREDYHFAIELLQQAVRVQPKAEYYALLARCQARNPRWFQKAVSSYGRALQLSPDDHDVRIELAQVLEAAGDRPRARREYDIVLSRMPGHPEATAGLARLKGRPAQAEGEKAWWEKLFFWK